MNAIIELPDDLYRQAELQAASEGSSLKELMTESLRLLLRGRTRVRSQRLHQAPLRLSSGRVFPALSNSEINELLGDEDVRKAA